jgi:hypothetical protein
MKSHKDFRNSFDINSSEDSLKKKTRLEPMRKSSREESHMFSTEDEDIDAELYNLRKRESAFDYFDDEE